MKLYKGSYFIPISEIATILLAQRARMVGKLILLWVENIIVFLLKRWEIIWLHNSLSRRAPTDELYSFLNEVPMGENDEI